MSDSGVFADSPQLPRRDDTVLANLALELTLLSRHFPSSLRRQPGCQLDRSAFLILTRLNLGTPLSLRELAEALRLDVSTVNRQVGAMLEQGLVERVPDPEGGMARKIHPSAQGLKLLETDRAHNNAGIGTVIADWPEEDVALLSHLVQRFNSSVENLERNPWPRPTGSNEEALPH